MTTIAIRSSAWEALTEGQKGGLIEMTGIPKLGEPALYLDENDVEWRLHDDSRITEEQVASVAALMDNPTLIPEIDELDSTPDEEDTPDAT